MTIGIRASKPLKRNFFVPSPPNTINVTRGMLGWGWIVETNYTAFSYDENGILTNNTPSPSNVSGNIVITSSKNVEDLVQGYYPETLTVSWIFLSPATASKHRGSAGLTVTTVPIINTFSTTNGNVIATGTIPKAQYGRKLAIGAEDIVLQAPNSQTSTIGFSFIGLTFTKL